MSFSPGSKKAAAMSSESSATSDLPFLQEQKKAPSNSVAHDPAKGEKIADEARRKTLRTLNAIKIVAPVLAAVTEKHGGGGSEDEAVATFRRLVSQASDMSEFVVKELGEDPASPSSYWLRNMLERTFCEMLKDQVQRGKEGSLKLVQPILSRMTKMDWPESDGAQEFERWGSDTTVRVALLKATAPVMIKSASFDFFRTDLAKDFEEIMMLLMGAASRATLAMADPAANEKERASLFSVLVGEAGNLYASAWTVCGKQIVANLSSLNDKELAALLAQHPAGLPLNKVNELFEKNFGRLVALSTKLVPQKPGKIEARMKTPEKA